MKPRKGFSIVEVLVSLGLLGLVLTVVIGLFLSGYAVAATNNGFTVAGSLASAEVSRLKQGDYTQLKGRAEGAAQTTTTAVSGVSYTVTSQVANLDGVTGDPGDAGMLQVLVTVTWTDTTVLSERGLEATQRKAHTVDLECQVGPNVAY